MLSCELEHFCLDITQEEPVIHNVQWTLNYLYKLRAMPNTTRNNFSGLIYRPFSVQTIQELFVVADIGISYEDLSMCNVYEMLEHVLKVDDTDVVTFINYW